MPELSKYFVLRLHNRAVFPTKHVLVCEDDLDNQKRIAKHLADLFRPYGGQVQVSFVPGGLQAAAVMSEVGVDLVILDHDMPFGSGSELLNWMKSQGHQPPVITFSGIPYNNSFMVGRGAQHNFDKEQVIEGRANSLIRELLKLP